MKKQPNIIFILTDDQGYGDLGCHGNPDINTPNIDAFYNEAVRCTDYHVGPTCAPTRSGIMTGHCANSTGVWHTIGGRSLLRADEWTIANALSENGYKTGIFGKWHLGDSYPYRAMDRGFQKTVVHGGGGITQAPDYWGNDYFGDTYMVDGEATKFNGYCTDVFFKEAFKFIDENKDNPFLCFVTTNAPHVPLNVEKKYVEQYKGLGLPADRERFYGMISNIDENFGKLEKKIKDMGLEDNTIFIFMTDNGSGNGTDLDENGYVVSGYNGGFRGKKNSEYEGGHRVPFFIKYPNGKIGGGVDMNYPIANVDLMPTFLELCGVDVPENRTFDGMSVAKNLVDVNADMTDRVIVTDSQRLTNPVKWNKSAVIWNDYRLINGKELYNVKLDREQRCDIASENSEIVKKLRDEYDIWWDKVTVKAEEEIPLHITEEESYISSHDQRGEMNAYSQDAIRQGNTINSYWEILIPKDGKYSFEMRRWPKTHPRAIKDGIDTPDIEFKGDDFDERNYEKCVTGKALNIVKAYMSVGENVMTADVKDEMEEVTFVVDLKAGNYHLTANFIDDEDVTRCSYFVYAKQI